MTDWYSRSMLTTAVLLLAVLAFDQHQTPKLVHVTNDVSVEGPERRSPVKVEIVGIDKDVGKQSAVLPVRICDGTNCASLTALRGAGGFQEWVISGCGTDPLNGCYVRAPFAR